MNVQQRQAIEKRIAKAVINAALAAGYTVSVCDGEDFPIKRSANAAAILASMFSTDGDALRLRKDGRYVGTVFLVYGNDGWDVIADHSLSLSELIDPITSKASEGVL